MNLPTFGPTLFLSILLTVSSVHASYQCAISLSKCERSFQKKIKKYKQHEYLTPECEEAWSCTEQYSCNVSYCVCGFAGPGNDEPGANEAGQVQCRIAIQYDCGKYQKACGESLE